MELLFSKHPLFDKSKSVKDYLPSLLEDATDFNVATGFITNDAIAELKHMAEYKEGEMQVKLFIGMNYLDGFTNSQLKGVISLDEYLRNKNMGNVFLSPSALFHGKMYSFMKSDTCLKSFVGSSNLGSFLTDTNTIESDVMFQGNDGLIVNSKILDVIKKLGTDFSSCDVSRIPIIQGNTHILDNYEHVTVVKQNEINHYKSLKTIEKAEVKLKTEAKSNLNTYFGAGKIKGKYSPRGWYEVEIIISINDPCSRVLPRDTPFTVVTEDGYKFDCKRQGDYGKNFRSCHDLKILGRWIKGHMEEDGALQIGTPVTDDTLRKFGKNKLVFEKKVDNVWLLSMR